jgi:hypothetical protein
MTKAALILIIATLMTASVFASVDDVEIIDVDDSSEVFKEPPTKKPE